MNTSTLTKSSLIAASYVIITLIFAPISFWVIQFRLAEALTILAIFGKTPIIGLTLGCFLSNAIGLFLGFNSAGPIDLVIGTLATLIAALLTYYLRKIRFKNVPILAAVPPILINAIFIGAELTYITTGSFVLNAFSVISLQIALGQLIPCFVLGLILVKAIEAANLDEYFISE